MTRQFELFVFLISSPQALHFSAFCRINNFSIFPTFQSIFPFLRKNTKAKIMLSLSRMEIMSLHIIHSVLIIAVVISFFSRRVCMFSLISLFSKFHSIYKRRQTSEKSWFIQFCFIASKVSLGNALSIDWRWKQRTVFAYLITERVAFEAVLWK